MSASDHLNPAQFFEFEPADEDFPRHRVTAYEKRTPGGVHHGLVGELHWSPDTGEIGTLRVPEEQHQRRGAATAMYRRAQEISSEQGLQPPQHSAYRSPAGTAWAESTGAPVPPLSDEAKATNWAYPSQQFRGR